LATKRETGAAKKAWRDKALFRQASSGEIAKLFDASVQRGNPALKPVADELRRLVKKIVPQSREAVNPWNIPSFDFHGPFCLMMVGNNHVTLVFSRGTSLADAGGLLEGTGKNLRHVKLKDAHQLRDPRLRQLILEAAALNRETPLTPSMKVKRPT
jgi:hypothetical protein